VNAEIYKLDNLIASLKEIRDQRELQLYPCYPTINLYSDGTWDNNTQWHTTTDSNLTSIPKEKFLYK